MFHINNNLHIPCLVEIFIFPYLHLLLMKLYTDVYVYTINPI